jgi:hypothetical protein
MPKRAPSRIHAVETNGAMQSPIEYAFPGAK